MMYSIYDPTPPKYSVGDTVWLTYEPVLLESNPYPARIITVLTDDDTHGCGTHYVVLVPTHVDDYIDLRRGHRVWGSREEYLKARQEARAYQVEMDKILKDTTDAYFKELIDTRRSATQSNRSDDTDDQ